MIISSIEISKGRAVGLVGTDRLQRLDAENPITLAKKSSLFGEMCVWDWDHYFENGSNQSILKQILKFNSCRIGGGIKNIETALDWLNFGASKVIFDWSVDASTLSQLPSDRIMIAFDVLDSLEIVQNSVGTGKQLLEFIETVRDHVGGIMVTFLEHKGTDKPFDLQIVQKLKAAVGPQVELTVGGGISNLQDALSLIKQGIYVQACMAFLNNSLDLGDFIYELAKSDRADGLFTTIVANERRVVLGQVYSSKDSIRKAIELGRGVYWSRSRKSIWVKGETSGAEQELLKIELDCDRDSLLFIVKQGGPGFCHLNRFSCFNKDFGLGALETTIQERKLNAPVGSYTKRLFEDAKLLDAKILEEANELIEANEKEHVTAEAADLIYFALVKCAKHGVTVDDIEQELDRRSLKVTRRRGDAKPHIVKQLEERNSK
eukprot:TRINITY_DN8138_c0_g1_i1.p1 TRINITY_DN8138_c0_g1~~TRINITY_DN8138_c0_g1_i1.p1  ORF type:complete len:433 (-),score=82.24 TRINITY_DN8138_c0_g1_i1:75-1373(-)